MDYYPCLLTQFEGEVKEPTPLFEDGKGDFPGLCCPPLPVHSYHGLRLTEPLRLISLAQDQNLLAPGNQAWVFSCPVHVSLHSRSCSKAG